MRGLPPLAASFARGSFSSAAGNGQRQAAWNAVALP